MSESASNSSSDFDIEEVIGGIKEEKKVDPKKKKKPGEESKSDLNISRVSVVVQEEEKELEIVGEENMYGNLLMTKDLLDGDKKNGLNSLLEGGVGAIGNIGGKLIKSKPYFEIKKGILYKYAKQNARRSDDSFILSDVSTIDQMFDKEAKPTKKFNMIYKAYYCVFDCEDEKVAEKWVKSIKLCKANIADYEHELIEDEEGFGKVELDR